MKCQFCGANIDIESDVCPFCGLSKSQFESHRKDMRDYSDAFHATREGVVKDNQKFSSNAASITVLSILIIGILLLFIAMSQNYEIYHAVQTAKILRNSSVHTERLDSELAKGDYETFYFYFYGQDIQQLDRNNVVFAKYQLVYLFSSQYQYTMSFLQDLWTWTEEDYATQEERVSCFAEQYFTFLEYYNRYVLESDEYSPYPDASYAPEMLSHIEQMKSNLELCMMTYLGVDESVITDMQTMSKAHMIVTLEEIVLNPDTTTEEEETTDAR